MIVFYQTDTKFLTLPIFWENCPTPNLNQLNVQDNIYFIFLYGLIFIGSALYSSGKKLSIRLDEINTMIENQLIQASINNRENINTREEMRNNANINDSSIFSQIHQLYIAPLVITIIGGVVLKLSGF
ncbi:hypothetical protein M947_10565 [Sulfurimonas hongkongensis]|uniref:Uncharacterized protein n=1 Tax=Sulfurimonas hongkongensis TaxID=1172190 RepID=T0KMJ1_9BACT|nr:hypothetical protein M947_10565 [Sulfurimonas hongkongensis]